MPEIGDWKLVAPEWPHIKGQRVRVRVGESKYLFGNIITGDSKVNTVLCDGGEIVQTDVKGDVQ